MNKKGFTLLELIMVLVILANIIAIALPEYSLMVEKARAAEAIRAMESIKFAEQAYLLSSGNFKIVADASLDATLGVQLLRDNWTYDVNQRMLAVPPGYRFTVGPGGNKWACIKATRTTGSYAGMYIYDNV